MVSYDEVRTSRGSARRGTTPSVKLQAKTIIEAMGGPIAQRRSHPQGPYPTAKPVRETHPPRQAAYQQQEYYTDEDEVVQQHPLLRQPSHRGGKRRGRGSFRLHPLVWWAAGIVLVFALGRQITGTAGASWWVSHVSDPSTFGELHGQTISANFVESQEQPVTVVGTIIHCSVQILVLNGSNSRFYTGPNLSTNDFPDPDEANVELQAGYFGGGHLDLQITILSDQFPTPYSRFSIVLYLYGDGLGNFKSPQQQ